MNDKDGSGKSWKTKRWTTEMFEGVWVFPYFLEKTNLLSSDFQKTFFLPDNQISYDKSLS